MPKNLLYSNLRPSGVDMGAPAERAMERMLREKRARQDRKIKAIEDIRKSRDKRDQFAVDAFSQDIFVEQAGILSEQVMRLNDDVLTEMTDLVDKYRQTGSVEDKIALAKYKTKAITKAESIGKFLEMVASTNNKFTETDDKGNPVYSLELNADQQVLMNQLLSGQGGYKLDLREFKVTTPDGDKVDAIDFMNKNFTGLTKYVNPEKAVDDWLQGIDRSPYDTHQVEWQGEDGKIHSKTVYKTDYQELKDKLYEDFNDTFNSDNLAFRQYAAETNHDPKEVTEKMFKSGLRRNGFMFETVKTSQAIQKETVSGRKTAKKIEDSQRWLIDLASGGTQAGGTGVLKDVSRTTEAGGMEKVYKAERFMNPLTGEIGLAIHTTTAKGEPQPPIIIDNLATPQGAAEVTEMAVSKKGSTYVRYDEMNMDAEQLAQIVRDEKAKLSEDRKKELTSKAPEIATQVAMDRLFADIGKTAFEKGNIDRSLETLFSTLQQYVPSDVIERVKKRVGTSSRGLGLGLGKPKYLDVDDKKFETLNPDSKKVIITAISDVINEEMDAVAEEGVLEEGILEEGMLNNL